MIISQMILIFGLIAVGYLAYVTGILDSVSNQKLSRMLINLTLPATIISSSIGQKMTGNNDVILVFCIAITVYIIYPFISWLICKIFSFNKISQLMLTYSNIGFMGIPIVSTVYGVNAVFYVSIFMMIFNISIFSHGIHILNPQKVGQARDWRGFLRKFLNPGILCAVIAIIIYLFQIPVHKNIAGIISSVGSITTPLAMVVIGSTLGAVPLKEAFNDKKLYLFVIAKMLVLPLITWAIIRIFITNPILIGISVILAGLPTGGNVLLLSTEYDSDTKLVTRGIFLSTLMSVVMIPIWIFLLGSV